VASDDDDVLHSTTSDAAVATADTPTAAPTPPYLSPIIRDGYNRTSLIPARDCQWSAVKVRWRKLTADQIDSVAARFMFDTSGGKCRHYAEEMAGVFDDAGRRTKSGNVVDWDIKDAAGAKLPVTADAIRHSEYEWYVDLLAVVSGQRPEWEEKPRGPECTAENEVKN
jgi:hypothetical protein